MTTKDRVASRPADAKVTGTWANLHARRVAYAVKEGPLHVDGAPGPAGEGARGVSFSDDGKHIAYYLKRGAEGHFVRDGEVRGAFAGFGTLPPVWSSDGRTAFMARKLDASAASGASPASGKAEWWIVVDGEARFGPFTDDQPGFGSGKSKLVWSPKGIAYVAVNGDSMRVEVDGAPLGEAFALVRDPVFFGEGDAARFAFRARRDDKWWLVSMNHVHGPFDSCEEPVFAPDGRLYFVAGDGGRAKVYVDGAVVEEYPNVHDLAVGAASHALIAGDGTNRRVVHGAWQSDDYANLLGLDITPDGAHTSVVAEKGGQEHILVDGVVVASAASIPHGMTALSIDGAHVAFLVKGAAQSPSCVKIDDVVQSEPFDNLCSDIVFAPDGKSVAFMAEQGEEMHVFALDAGAAKPRTRPASNSASVEATATPSVEVSAAAVDEVKPAAASAEVRGGAGVPPATEAPAQPEAKPAKKAAPKKAASKSKADDDDKPAKKAAPKKAAKAKR